MSRFLKWVYSVGFFLAMCGLLVAGTYQYKDNLNIPYNINLFGCGAASCTSMTLQNSAGTEIFTNSNPGSVSLTNSSVTLSGSPVSVGVNDGSDATQGAKGDAAVTNGFSTSSVIALLKGILNNVVTPISVTGTVNTAPSVSPQNVTVGNTVAVNNTPQGSPQNVTVGNTASPAGVAVVNNVAVTPPTPLNITVGTSPISVNVAQYQGTTAASPTSYGVAPTGSVQGVNAFVTNQPTVVLSGSPVSVGIAAGSSPVNVTGNFSTTVNSPLGVTPFNGASPQNVTLSASPVSVAISTVSSPVNVTGNFTTTVASPLGVIPFNGASPQNVTMASPLNVTVGNVNPNGQATMANSTPVVIASDQSAVFSNLTKIQSQNIASPQTYGTAPVGSVEGVNAFVTSLPASPLGVAIAGPTPLNVTLGTPLNVTLAQTPINITIASTPQNMTLATGVNVTQIAGNNIASPTGYGTAPVGSVIGVNAFVTNNVNVTTPTPLQVTLPGTPLNVTIAQTPLNVTIASTPQNVTLATGINITQVAGINIASPSSYGTAPVGSTMGVNAFVTNGNPNGNAVMASSSPVTIASDQTPVSIKLGVAPVASSVVAYVATTVSFLTNTALALGATPGIVGVHQLGMVQCATVTPFGTPQSSFLQIWDVTPHASGSDIVNLTSIQPLTVLAVAGTPVQQTSFNIPSPGLQFNHGITVAFTQNVKSATAVGFNLNCSFGYN